MTNPDPAFIVTIPHPHPFGMIILARSWQNENYHYGFNGMENDDETYGNDNALDFGARVYDARLGRWFSVDYYFNLYPQISPFGFATNNPIYFIDHDGNIIFDSKGNPVTLVFNTETGELTDIQGTKDAKLKETILNTWNEGLTGQTTINELNADDIKVQIVMSEKAGFLSTANGVLVVVGLTCQNKRSTSNLSKDGKGEWEFLAEDGTLYNSRIYIFNSTIDPTIADESQVDVLGEDLYIMGDSKERDKVLNDYHKNPDAIHYGTDEALDRIMDENLSDYGILVQKIKPLTKIDQEFGAVTTLIHENVHVQDNAGKLDDQGEYLPRIRQIGSYKESGRPLPDASEPTFRDF